MLDKLAAPASLQLIAASRAWQLTRQPHLGITGLGRFSALRVTDWPEDGILRVARKVLVSS